MADMLGRYAIEGPEVEGRALAVVPGEAPVPEERLTVQQRFAAAREHLEDQGRTGLAWAARVPGRCLRQMVRKPCWAFAATQLLVLVLFVSMYRSGALSTDFESFTRATSDASLKRDAYKHAWEISEYRSSARRLQTAGEPGGFLWAYFTLHVFYHRVDGGSLWDEEALFAISQYENRLRGLQEWRDLCGGKIGCDPGETVLNYVFPEFQDNASAAVAAGRQAPSSDASKDRALRFTGRGTSTLPIEVILPVLRDSNDILDTLHRFVPEDYEVAERRKVTNATVLSSHFSFAISLPGYASSGAMATTFSKAKALFNSFVEGDLYGVLTGGDELLEEEGIKVYYSNPSLDEYDLFYELWSDVRLAVGSILLILLVVRVSTHSWLMACLGLFLILESIPLGFVCFKQITGLEKINIVNCLAVFVIVGLGSDLVFVLNDGWTQSSAAVEVEELGPGATEEEQEEHRRVRLRKRITWLWANAGSSCVTATFCSVCSFLVNLGSVIMPLREFGLFMGLCVIWSLLLLLAAYPLGGLYRESRRREPERPGAGSTAVVPVALEPPEPPSPGSAQSGWASADFTPSEMAKSMPKKSSSAISFFFMGHYATRLGTSKRVILAAFVLVALVCVFAFPVMIEVAGDMPKIFPVSHNQVEGKRIRSLYDKDMVSVAAAPLKQDAWVCDVTSPVVDEVSQRRCTDINAMCANSISAGFCEASSSKATLEMLCRKSCGFCGFCLWRTCQVEVQPEIDPTSPGQCQCFLERQDNASYLEAHVEFQTTVVGFGAEVWPSLQPHLHGYLQSLMPNPSGATVAATGETRSASDTFRQPPLVQEHWRSGKFAVWPAFDVTSLATHSGSSSADRKVRQYCYCGGIKPCETTLVRRGVFHHPLRGPGGAAWSETASALQPVPAPPPARRLHEAPQPAPPARRLQEVAPQPVAPARRLQSAAPAKVNVVWGLLMRELGPSDLFLQTHQVQMWDLDPMFQPADPWVQRSLMAMSENLPEALHVGGFGRTLPQGYENWLRTSGQDFPSRDFKNTFKTFLTEMPSYRKMVLLEPSTGEVLAMRSEFVLDRPYNLGLSESMELMNAWGDFVKVRNADAAMRANRAWHVSSLWVRVEAQHGIISSTAASIGISVMVGFFTVLGATRDAKLACLCMLSVMLTILSQLFFMVVVMQWSIGPIEVVALIVFLGYMFTFNLHIAHAYSRTPEGWGVTMPGCSEGDAPAERLRRVRYALGARGRSVLSSAITTMGCAVFLLFCTLQFFVRFGVVIISISVLSLVYSLIFLPSLLVLVGPTSRSLCDRFVAGERPTRAGLEAVFGSPRDWLDAVANQASNLAAVLSPMVNRSPTELEEYDREEEVEEVACGKPLPPEPPMPGVIGEVPLPQERFTKPKNLPPPPGTTFRTPDLSPHDKSIDEEYV